MKKLFVIVLFLYCGLVGCEGPVGPKGEAGIPGKDGNTTAFYFQEGFKGYQGTKDITVAEGQEFNSEEIFINADFITNPVSIRIGLIRFDNIANPVLEEMGNDFYVNEAILYLRVEYEIDQGDHWTVSKIKSDAPLFDEINTTYELANAADTWSPLGISEKMTDIPLVEVDGKLQTVWLPCPLSRTVVKEWLMESEKNKGLTIINDNRSAESIITIFSSEHQVEEFRPMLYINVEKMPSNGRVEAESDQEYFNRWKSMSYKEKMAPLYRVN